VTKDIDAVSRKIEHWHQGSIAALKLCIAMNTVFGTVFGFVFFVTLC
jgi:hypothetical protein